MREGLPKGWAATELENCTQILDDFRKPVSSEERNKRIEGKKSEVLYPYYGATGRVGYIDDYLIDGIYVLLGEDGAPFFDSFKNKAYIVKGKIWVNNHAHILNSFTNNSFLCHYLNQFDYSDYITGTTRLKLTQTKLKKIPIKIPPLNEQKRIAAKLDHIMPKIDAVKERLERIPKIIKRFRQSMLTAAVTGKLTEKWREKHLELKSWSRIELKDYSLKIGSGATPRGGKSVYNNSGIPLIRSLNVRFKGFTSDGLAFINSEQAEALRNVAVKPNDVLLNITGASIGRVTIAPSEMEGARVNQHVCIIRTNKELIPTYLAYFLASPLMPIPVNEFFKRPPE